MKRHLLLCCLIGIMSILGYFYFQRKIIFIDHPTIETIVHFIIKNILKKLKMVLLMTSLIMQMI